MRKARRKSSGSSVSQPRFETSILRMQVRRITSWLNILGYSNEVLGPPLMYLWQQHRLTYSQGCVYNSSTILCIFSNTIPRTYKNVSLRATPPYVSSRMCLSYQRHPTYTQECIYDSSTIFRIFKDVSMIAAPSCVFSRMCL
jgi:hypothetical protein